MCVVLAQTQRTAALWLVSKQPMVNARLVELVPALELLLFLQGGGEQRDGGAARFQKLDESS